MSSTFVDFDGRGFEAHDSAIEVLLALLAEEIDKMEAAPEWMLEMRDEWRLQATAGFGFGVMPGLDRYITDDSRRNTVVELSRRALSKIQSWGDPIPRETLNALHTGGEGATFTQDIAAGMFVRTARYFINLLEGTLEPWETDARFDQHA